VVRIYRSKAQFLLNDCNEALLKIKLAFKPGNVDLPSHKLHAASRDALVLPDTITELDLFAPLPDPEELLRDPDATRGPGRDPTLLDFGTSQLLPDSQTPSRKEQRRMLLDDDDLGLDLGLEPGEQALLSPGGDEPSIEIGRRAHTPKPDRPSMLDDDDLGLDLGLDMGDTTIGAGDRQSSVQPPPPMDDDMPMLGGNDDDVAMGGMDIEIAERNAQALARASAEAEKRRQRDSASPLSSIRSSVERDLEQTFQLDQAQMQEDDETMVQAAQRVKRRRVIRQDPETELHNSQIKKQQEDRSGITKAPSFLPRDPLLLQLMEMQRNGEFVSNIMGDGRMQGWAPELRGILSLEIVRQAGDRKRKRDSGVADLETDNERQETPRLEIPQDLDDGFQVDQGAGDFGGNTTLGGPNDDAAGALMSDGLQPPAADDNQDHDDDLDLGYDAPAFDTTEAPLLHPSQTGPVSQGTKYAARALRLHFAPDHPIDATEPPTPSTRRRTEAKFTDLCPEKTTSRQNATKVFFELLVLGTKDAIKVEQDNKDLGLPIRIRGKRGLWGPWADMGASGATQEQQEEAQEGEVQA
jgi:cohesin complex subunit SCC1